MIGDDVNVFDKSLCTLWYNPCTEIKTRKYYLQIDDTIQYVSDYIDDHQNEDPSNLDEWIEQCMQDNDQVYIPMDINNILLDPTELYFNQSKEAFGIVACMNNIMQHNWFTTKDLYRIVIVLGIISPDFNIDTISPDDFLLVIHLLRKMLIIKVLTLILSLSLLQKYIEINHSWLMMLILLNNYNVKYKT